MQFLLGNVFQLIFIIAPKCLSREEYKSKNLLPYFRRQVEQDFDSQNIKKISSENLQNHLVSFLNNNIKEIFSDDEITEHNVIVASLQTPDDKNPKNLTRTAKASITTNEEDHNLADVGMNYENVSILTPKMMNTLDPISPLYEIKQAKKQTHKQLLLEDSLKKSEQKLVHNNTFIEISALTMEKIGIHEPLEPGQERSCIFCNNVKTEECADPKKKLLVYHTFHQIMWVAVTFNALMTFNKKIKIK